jgi:hypothetical protein
MDVCVCSVRFFCFYIVSSETASRPNKRLVRTYHWISLFNVIYKVSKLAYRIWVILIANKRFIKKTLRKEHRLCLRTDWRGEYLNRRGKMWQEVRENCITRSSSPIRATCPAHLILLTSSFQLYLANLYSSISSASINYWEVPECLHNWWPLE